MRTTTHNHSQGSLVTQQTPPEKSLVTISEGIGAFSLPLSSENIKDLPRGPTGVLAGDLRVTLALGRIWAGAGQLGPTVTIIQVFNPPVRSQWSPAQRPGPTPILAWSAPVQQTLVSSWLQGTTSEHRPSTVTGAWTLPQKPLVSPPIPWPALPTSFQNFQTPSSRVPIQLLCPTGTVQGEDGVT